MFTYRGQVALITGASSGIGAAFARELARRGMDLILVARSEDKLRALADQLAQQYAVRAEVIAADLSEAGAALAVYEATQQRGLHVDLLVNNAGFGTHGRFELLELARQHEEIMLNVAAVVELSHVFVAAMVQRGAGAIINVASTASFQPTPYMAVYGASKAFVLSFSEALWAQYRRQGVRVLALCPGAVDTHFFEVAGDGARVGTKMAVEVVVAAGLRALERDRSYVIPGLGNYLLAQAARISPRSLVARVSARLLRPRKRGLAATSAR